MRTAMVDVVVIGAGVVGCSAALALSERGLSVCMVERSVAEEGASWAAAGILGLQAECDKGEAMMQLCKLSQTMYGAWASALVDATGIDVGYRRCGVLQIAWTKEEADALVRQAAGLSADALNGDELRVEEKALSDEILFGLRFGGDARIDPPLLMQALRAATNQAHVQLQSGVGVRRILVEGRKATGVMLDNGTELRASHVVLSAGCWSSLIEGTQLACDAILPVRGQIVELMPATRLCYQVVIGPDCYLSPRDDGRILVGSTQEFVGFSKGVTAGAVRDLIAGAIRLVPGLGQALVRRTWSGLRPYAVGELPLLGEGEIGNLIVATGHYRAGVLLAPITGEIVASLVMGGQPPLDLQPFSVTRLQRTGMRDEG